MHPRINFIIAGAQKCGTSALADSLRHHNDIFMATPKELHYFDRDEVYRHDVNYNKYHSFFKGAHRYKSLGEATPMYMYHYDAPRRIWHYSKEMKIIIILRNPIERAYSSWNMERYRNIEPLDFIPAINAERKRRTLSLPLQLRNFSYIDRGFYSEQIRRVWNFFPPNQTLIIRSDEFRINQTGTINRVCDFLELPPIESIPSIQSNSTPYAAPMKKEDFEYLLDIFKVEIDSLEHLLNWDCTNWKIFTSNSF